MAKSETKPRPMLKFECYTFNFHVWLHALAAATPQREAAQARKTIISIGRVTKMLNLLLNSHHRRLHLTKSFSKPPQKAQARRGRFWGKAFSSCCGQAVTSRQPCDPSATRASRGSGCRERRGRPGVQTGWTYPASHKPRVAFEQCFKNSPARQQREPCAVQRRAEGDLIEGREQGELLPRMFFCPYIPCNKARF